MSTAMLIHAALRRRLFSSLESVYSRATRHTINQVPRQRLSTESKPENQESEEANRSAQASVEDRSPLSELEELSKRIEQKNVEITDLTDKSLRMLAEMENVRMIARRDVENAKTYAITPFAKALLGIADNLGLALRAVPESALNKGDCDPQLKGLFMGIGATENELLKVFAQHGVHRFGQIGDRFDPNKYQAMFEASSEEYEPGRVISVSKLGYTIGDRVLRPAEVGVSRSP